MKPSTLNPAAAAGKRLHLRTHSPVGIDAGARTVKAVQLGRERFGDGRWRVTAVAEVPRDEAAPPATPDKHAPQQPRPSYVLTESEVRRLVGTLERQGFRGIDVVLAVPNERVYSSMLELPPRSSNAPLEQIARMEVARAHRFAPDSFEMGCWDLPAAARATKQTPVMAVACTHADAAAVMDPFESEGLNVCALDVRAAALARACHPLLTSDAGAITGIVDLGWTGATLSLMHQDVAIYGRTLGDCGLLRLYHTLSSRLGLEIEVIDYMLSDSGIAGVSVTPAEGAAAPGRRKGKAAIDAPGLIAAHFEAAVHELHVSLTYAQHQYPDTPLSRLLVVGGGGCIRGVTEHLRATLGIEARAVAPKDVVECSPGVAEKCGSPGMTAALGLAQFTEKC
jgi:Tfp pilus assembly PilM family ATPase